MARRNLKKNQVDTSAEVVKAKPENMNPSGQCNIFAAFVLVVAVCVLPMAALSNCKYKCSKYICRSTLC